MRDTLLKIISTLNESFTCVKPVSPGEDLFDGISETKKNKILNGLTELKEALDKAIEEDDPAIASDYMIGMFGERFPKGESPKKSDETTASFIRTSSPGVLRHDRRSGTMVLSITQTWNKMACQSSFSKSESYSDVIYLDIDGPQGVVLKFTYTNKSHDLTCNLAEFSGYNELRLSDKNTLTGTYYTKRIPSTRGNLLLIRRSSNDVINETTG